MKKILFAVAVVALLGVAGTAVAAKPTQDNNKQVYCNQEGDSGKWKAQISNGNTEHEHLLTGVFVHDQNDVTAAMDAQCQTLYGTPPHVPVPCVAGYHETGKADNGDSICAKDDDPVVPTEPTGTTADSNKGEVPTDPVTGEVFYGK